ncbi:MAG: ribonuclease III [Victivallaceae bacterium]|nr:ribonuclease III [Victivallaceae bacterium]
MSEDIEKLKDAIGYTFRHKELAREALTHRSYAAEARLDYDNQRLEFLGDAVLEIILSERLYRQYPNSPEGELTQMRSAIVRESSLAQLARHLSLGEFLLLGHGEQEADGKERASTLADLYEAMLGAIYLDGGFEAAANFVNRLADVYFPSPLGILESINPKGELQEYTQRRFSVTPEYTVLGVSGPEHQPCFSVKVSAAGCEALGEAASRKGAERAAAGELLKRFLREEEADSAKKAPDPSFSAPAAAKEKAQ